MINREDLKAMSIEELKELINLINMEIESRKSKNEFAFDFEATNDPRKGIPYVARLYYQDGKIQRDFYNLDRSYGKKSVTISGTYTARTGDIIEIRTGGSWKNDYRSWFLVTEKGELKHVADIDKSNEKSRVERYLKGEITANEL